MSPAPIAVTAWGIHVPDVSLDAAIGVATGDPACPPERAQELLGLKGLLNKDAATRLALCAIHRALGLPPRAPRASGPPDPRVAIVASSNLGNVSTVQAVVRTLRTGSLKDVSALDAPNASSNVIATTAAIWFRFGGPNLMVCSGATSGLDAVSLGCTLLRARRADRVIVVGSEPGDAAAHQLFARRAATQRGDRLCAGAAAVVLERADDAAATDAPVLGAIHHSMTVSRDDGDSAALTIGPALGESNDEDRNAGRTIDLTRIIGDAYGALGVLQIAVAAALMTQSPRPSSIAVRCGDELDGWRTTIVRDGAALSVSVPAPAALAREAI